MPFLSLMQSLCIYICYFMYFSPYTHLEGILRGGCSEALRSTDKTASERASKGFRARAKGLRSKWPVMQTFFVCIFCCP